MNGVPEYRTHIASEILGTTNREFKQYFKYYDQLVVPDDDVHVVQVQQPEPGDLTPITHADVLEAIRVIRGDPTRTLVESSKELHRKLEAKHSRTRVRSVVLLATRVMFMFDPAISETYGPDYTIGSYKPASWHSIQSLHGFMLECFPRASLSSERARQALADGRSIKAWKLKTRSGIIFKGTDNLAQHLLLDRSNRVLYLFHHTSFLKAQLRRFQSLHSNQEEDPLQSLKRGSLPPRLLAETLHSLQSILFQWRDPRSIKILKRLVKKKGFDEDCTWDEGNTTFKDSSHNDEYFYWGCRLVELHDFAKDRRPRNRFERWIKWQTSESNAFAIALAALIISVAVGLLSLALSAFQAWIAWKAWKDSVNMGNEP
ncbi:hypothetical protein EDB81DRAFT_792048 [Dactylonectria macrodidyma]|uniref:Uncharacterized protein n=1 Tax=Dactylonectria macrodidyma TaxID=307937 RepID=A0A9P9J501_9HYPO|nr:hypothetical protein EDB81DRAFT_792048 [Dactylonectria macrodidyma]